MAMFDKHKGSKQQSSRAAEPAAKQQPPSMSATPSATASKVAMIGNGVSIAGDITADTDMKVEGLIEGRILQGSQLVEIGEQGRVIANIHAREVKIAGEVAGDIRGEEKVMITRTGRVQGNIIAPRVQLEDGSLFRGSIEMNPAQPVENKPKAARTDTADSPAKAAKTPPSKAPATASGAVRKEPGLTLKSG
jgi:cytoskeletal protein CcmA (bactofilin family)